MICDLKKLLAISISSYVLYTIAAKKDLAFTNNLINTITAQQQIQYIPLKGCSNAQVSRVVIEPSSYVVRRMPGKTFLKKCIQECTITSVCSHNKIGPHIYAADPVHKVIVAEYLDDQEIPRDQFGTHTFLYTLGSLIQKLHTLEVQDLEHTGSALFDCTLQVEHCSLYAIYKIKGRIDRAYHHLTAAALSPEKLKQLTRELTQKISTAYTSPMVLSHGDLHWGNCLYTHNRMWFIDYENSGLAPWWYDVGALGAHFSFTQESDDYLLEGYFNKNNTQCTEKEKSHYLWMKHAAMLFYALHRLTSCSLDEVQQAYNMHINLTAVQEAYKNGTLSLTHENNQAIVALAMINAVIDTYPVTWQFNAL